LTISDADSQLTALVVRQWLDEWSSVNFAAEERREEPEHFFYVFGLQASQLRALPKVYRRRAEGPRDEETAMQRAHDPERSREIRTFIQGGFPWSDLSDRQKQQQEYQDLRMPGWLPTAIVANILQPGTRRRGSELRDEDAIRIEHSDANVAKLILPSNFGSNSWNRAVSFGIIVWHKPAFRDMVVCGDGFARVLTDPKDVVA
jgi:hypothetical protein